jgi:hypothetical protein
LGNAHALKLRLLILRACVSTRSNSTARRKRATRAAGALKR